MTILGIEDDNKKNGYCTYVFGLLLLSAIMTFVMLLFYGKTDDVIMHKMRGILALGSMTCYLIAMIYICRFAENNIFNQFYIVNCCFMVTAIIMFIDLRASSYRGYSDLLVRISYASCFVFSVCIQSVYYKRIVTKVCTAGNTKSKIMLWLRNHIYLLLLVLLISVYLVMSNGKVMPSWDAGLLYNYSYELSPDIVFDIKASSYYDHISYAYVAIIAIVNSIFNNIDFTLSFIFSLAYIVSILCFYGIIKLIVPEKSDLSYTCATGIYACSPFVLGMIHDPYMDLFSIFLFVILIYFVFLDKKVMAVPVLFCLVYTKETVALASGFLFLGIVAEEFFCEKAESISKRFRRILNKSNITWCVVFVMWVYTYLFISHWSKAGDGTPLSLSYIANRCKMIFVLNFNWIIVTVAVIFTVISFKNHLENKKYIIPMLTTYICFLLFQLLFPTHNHSRYLCVLIVPMYILCAAGLCAINNRITRNICQLGVFILILVSTFKTIDPVTRSVFRSFNVGNSTMITTDETLSDSIIYNAQYEGYQRTVNSAISDILSDDKNAVICMPAEGDNIWSYDAIGNWGPVDGTVVVNELWNEKKNIRQVCGDKDVVPLNVIFATDKADFSSVVSDGQQCHYLYLSYVGTGDAEENIGKTCDVIGRNIYEKAGWVINDLVFKNNK